MSSFCLYVHAGDHDYCNKPDRCTDNEFYGDPEDCQCYYHCSNLVLFPICCVEELLFDIETGMCVWALDATCQEPCPQVTGPTTPPPQSGNYRCCNSHNGIEVFLLHMHAYLPVTFLLKDHHFT